MIKNLKFSFPTKESPRKPSPAAEHLKKYIRKNYEKIDEHGNVLSFFIANYMIPRRPSVKKSAASAASPTGFPGGDRVGC